MFNIHLKSKALFLYSKSLKFQGGSSHPFLSFFLHPQLFSPLFCPLVIPTLAWQVTGNVNNSGCGSPLLSKARAAWWITFISLFCQGPTQVTTKAGCDILLHTVYANTCQSISLPLSPLHCSLRCPLWLKWIDFQAKSTLASLPKAWRSMGQNGENSLSPFYNSKQTHRKIWRKWEKLQRKHIEW